MSIDRHYDLIILGGGAIGLAAALSAAEPMNGHPVVDGHRILVLEQFDFGNDRSSSAGRYRQFRYQYSQPVMSELVMRSVPAWSDLSDRAGHPLIGDSGCLWFGNKALSTTEGGIEAARQTMAELGIPYRNVDADSIKTDFGFSGLPSRYGGFFQSDGGTIDFESTIDVLLRECKKHGIHLMANESITHIEPRGNRVCLASDSTRYIGDSLIIATGPFLNESLAAFDRKAPIKIWDMISCYFPVRSSQASRLPTWFAFHEDPSGTSDLYYGFPELASGPSGHVRVCPDYPFAVYDDPRSRSAPSAKDFQGTIDWVRRYMPALEPKPSFQTQCMLALSTGDQPLFLDLISREPNVAICGAGWCAKIAPELGRLSAQLALRGGTTFDISPFTLGDGS